MRSLVILALAVGAFVLTLSPAAAGTSGTSLRISFWEDGSSARADSVWTLRCSPAGGSLPRPGLACARLAALSLEPFSGLGKGTVCTDIYGGPQKARVIGKVGGKPVWATFTRTNGCEIARWNGLAPWLLPPGGIS